MTVKTDTAVTLQKADLTAALRAAAGLKAKDVHLDFTGDTARLSAYTSDAAVTFDLGVDLDDDAGQVVVSRVALAGIVAYCATEIRLTFPEKRLAIESGCGTFEIPTTVDPAQFKHPEPSAISGEAVTFDAPTLVEILRRSLPFASRDFTRPVLCSVAVYAEQQAVAATDSYRLAVVRYGDKTRPVKKTEEPVAIGVEAAQSIKKLLGKRLGQVELRQNDHHIAVEFEHIAWTVRRVIGPPETGTKYGRFPSWWDLFPDEGSATATVDVDRDDLLTAARAAGVVAVNNTPLKLILKDGAASIATPESTGGKMTRALQSAAIDGEEMEAGFNADFLADICATAPVERLTLRLIAPLRPLLVEAARDRYLLMPIRLNV